jgi:hypothetical protein
MGGMSYLGDQLGTTTKYSFGNMGFAKMDCAKDLLNFEFEAKKVKI